MEPVVYNYNFGKDTHILLNRLIIKYLVIQLINLLLISSLFKITKYTLIKIIKTRFKFLTEKSIEDNQLEVDFNNLAKSICDVLYQQNVQSLIIEGGSKTIQTFIDTGLWDEARVFTALTQLVSGIKAPELKCSLAKREQIATDQLKTYYR